MPATVVAVGVATFAAALAGIALTRQADNVASFWLANAVLIAALARSPVALWRKLAPAFVAGNALANVAMGDTFLVSLGFGTINAMEGTIAVALLRRRCSEALTFERLSHIFCFTGAAGIAGPFVGATIGAGFVADMFGASYGQVWHTWFIGDALGNLTLGPFLLIARCRVPAWSCPAVRGLLAGAWPLALVAGTSLFVFVQSAQPLLFLLLPAALVPTYQLGPLGAALAVVVVAAIGGVATALGAGPMNLGHGSMAEHVLVLQVLIATVLACTLPVASLIAERNSLVGKLRAEANTDSLTGLANRAHLMCALRAAVTRAHGAREGSASEMPLAVAVLDVDHFKAVNDRWGHGVGDAALRQVAYAIAGVLRTNDLCARHGGEEFAVLMPGATLGEALRVCEHLRLTVAGTQGTFEGRPIPPVTISVGVAQLVPGEDVEKLLGRADRALYTAKHSGRNRVELAF